MIMLLSEKEFFKHNPEIPNPDGRHFILWAFNKIVGYLKVSNGDRELLAKHICPTCDYFDVVEKYRSVLDPKADDPILRICPNCPKLS